MKITIDVSQLVYSGHGVGRYVHELTTALLTAGSDHEFLLYAGSLKNQTFFKSLAQSQPYNKAKWIFSPIPPKLASLIFNNTNLPFNWLIGDTDVLHTSDWTEPNYRGAKVTTIHDLAFLRYPETIDKFVLYTQTARIKRVKKFGTFIVTDSASTKRDLIELVQVNPDKVRVIYPGISKSFQPASDATINSIIKKYHLPNNFVLTIGTKEPRKNLPRLIEATSMLNLNLVITGRHGWGTKLSAPHVTQIGYVEDRDLPALYSACDVFAYPSLYEGFGFPLLEAMACNAATVTSNNSSLAEIAGNASVLVEPTSVKSIADGLERALLEKDSLQKKGLKRSMLYKWEKTASGMLEVYEEIYRD